MTSFLARLRARRNSTTTTTSLASSSSLAQTPTTESPNPETPPAFQSPATRLDRKIVADINSLLALSEVDEGSGHDLQTPEKQVSPGALTPSPTRSRAQSDPRMQSEAAGSTPLGETTKNSLEKGKEKATEESEPANESLDRSDFLPRFLSTPTLSSPKAWSTFGRRRKKRDLPESGDFEERPGSRNSPAGPSETSSPRRAGGSKKEKGGKFSRTSTSSFRSATTFNHSVIPSRRGTSPSSPRESGSKAPSRQSSSKWSHGKPSSGKQGSTPTTVSSESHPHALPRHPSFLTSTPSRTDSSRISRIFPSPPEDANFDSPGTFGHPTPARTTPALNPGTSSLPPPPLPPWPSPDLASGSFTTPNQSWTERLAASSKRNREQTYPPSSLPGASAGTAANTVPFPSLPLTFGKSARTHSRRRKVSDVFSTSTKEGHEQISEHGLRTGTSAELKRRGSAEWSAQQATEGVMAGESQDYGWPADVSREMVRLSLGRTVEPEVHTRQEHVVPPSRPDQNVIATHSLSSSTPSSSSPSSSSVPAPAPIQLASPIFIDDNFSSGASGSGLEKRLSEHSGTAGLSGEIRKRSSSEGDSHRVPAPSTSEREGSHSMQQRATKSNNSIRLQYKRSLATSVSSGNGQATEPDQIRTPPSAAPTSNDAGSSTLLQHPALAVVSPTPQTSPGPSKKSSQVDTDGQGLRIPSSSVTPMKSEKSRGKRKADESEDGSPPGQKIGPKTTFAVQEGRGPPRVSSSSHAPSSFLSFHSRKRARISSDMMSSDPSGPISASNVGSWSRSSRSSSRAKAVPPSPSRSASHQAVSFTSSIAGRRSKPRSARSGSQASIPISAIISPRPASVDRLSSFHMRDPRKPPPKRDVGWKLRFKTRDEEGSPMQAWCFWAGFLFPPIWWFAALSRTPKTRVVGGTDDEKAITVDDPQIERDARAWRFRCRIVSVLFFFTYAPVIILLAIFAPRR